MATATATKTTPKQQLSFQQLEALWINAGGSPELAPTMAAVAKAESGGRYGPQSINDNPSTQDYSVGPWQINYYGNLLAGRTAEYGPPQTVANDPMANARAAVAISGNSTAGIYRNWTTYRTGAYLQYLPGGINQAGFGLSMSEAGRIAKAIVTAPAQVFQGTTGKNVGASPTGPDSIAGVTGLDTIGKDLLYVAVIAGGGMLILLGIFIIAIDLGIGGFAGKNPVVKTAKSVTRSRRKKQETVRRATVKRESTAARETRLAERHTADIKVKQARATELRTRTRHRAAMAKKSKAEKESDFNKGYIEGATDKASPNLRQIRRKAS